MRSAVVQVPAYSESPWQDRLAAIASQSSPVGWQVGFEAWVTPNCPSVEGCQTYQDAKAVEGVDVFEAPPGKLSARNDAHTHAVKDRQADVVVTWDADAPPLTDHTLSTLLMAFDDANVVASNGNPVATNGVIGRVVNYAARVEDRVRPQMHGQLSAFTAEGWRAAGPFRLDGLTETNIVEVRAEEEFAFRRRLAQHGRVVDVAEATVENDTRRIEAAVGNAFGKFSRKYPDTGFYDDRTNTTFNPRDR